MLKDDKLAPETCILTSRLRRSSNCINVDNEKPATRIEINKKIESDWNKALCPHHCNHQCERFPIGSIVYWVSDQKRLIIGGKGRYGINFGTVIEHYSGETRIQLYNILDTRTINGIPVKEFETPTRWQKLPKNWNYDTPLFKIEYQEIPNVSKYIKLTCSNDILKAIEDGWLVKRQVNDYCRFEADIDKSKGWRIIRKYDPLDSDQAIKGIPYTTVRFDKLYATYAEAQQKIDDIEAEWKRQSELSDYEWAIEEIDHTLDHWAELYRISDDIKEKYRNWILELKNIEDVEVRLVNGGIQWKYFKNKRWSNIDLSV